MSARQNLHLACPAVALALASALAACSGGTNSSALPHVMSSSNSSPSSPAHQRVSHTSRRAEAAMRMPAQVSAAARTVRPAFSGTPIADEALQIGNAYPSHEGWFVVQTYSPLDPSCGSLNWSYTNTIPGVTVTLNPTNTPLDGTTMVSFTGIPAGTPVQQWTNTITPTCSNPEATGTLPQPTSYTIYTVTLDIGKVPQVPAAPKIITNTTDTPVVGQFIELQASPQPAALVKTTWSPIPGDTVKTYDETANSAKFTALPASDLSKQTIDFYWIHGSNGSALPLAVNGVFSVYNSHCASGCTGAEDYWGLASAKANANVQAPTGVSLKSTTGNVLVNKNPPGCGVALHFGANNPTGCGYAGVKPGIAWEMTATAPNGGAGELDGTQLVDRKDVAGPFPTAHNPPGSYPGTNGFELDSCMRYGDDTNNHTAIASGAAATYSSQDNPGFGLSSQWRLFTALDTFKIYFVYKPTDQAGAPAGRQNIWVPLGHLDWGWSGTAKNTGTPLNETEPALQQFSRVPRWLPSTPNDQAIPVIARPNWMLARGQANPVNPRGVAANDPLPTWSALFKPSNDVCPPGG